MRHHYEQDQETSAQQLGKGKRVRKQVNYASENMQQDWTQQQQNLSGAGGQEQDYSEYSGESDYDDGSRSGDEEFDSSTREERRRRHRDRADEKLPPLLARVNGQLEVGMLLLVYAEFNVFWESCLQHFTLLHILRNINNTFCGNVQNNRKCSRKLTQMHASILFYLLC